MVPRSKSVLAGRKWLRTWWSEYDTQQTQSNGYLGCIPPLRQSLPPRTTNVWLLSSPLTP